MKTAKLKFIADIQIGYQARSRIDEDKNGNYRLIQGQDFKSTCHLQIDHLMTFSPDRNPKNYEVRKGDVLFQAKGIGHYAYYVGKNLENTIAAGSFYIIRIKKNDVLPYYLAWWINQKPAQVFFQSHVSGTYMPFVSKKILSELRVNVPSLSVQQKIIRIEKLLRHEQKLKDKLSDLRSHLITSICLQSIDEQGAK